MAQPLNDLLKRLDDVPDSFINSIETYENKLVREILALVELLERKDGEIILSSQNLAKIDTIASDLRNFMFNGEYAQIISTFANEFNLQKALTSDYFLSTFDSFSPKSLYDEAYRIAFAKELSLFSSEAINQVFITPIVGNLEAAITGKQTFKDLTDAIYDFVKGQEQLEGQLTRYVKLRAKDSFTIVNRTYSQVISTDLDVQFYQYLGGLIKDSRCFCVERAGKYFHKVQVQLFGAKKDLGSCRTESQGVIRWDGMAKGTNESTIFNFAGGYNCNHTFVPVSAISVPKEILRGAISNGWYKPSKKELELLGI